MFINILPKQFLLPSDTDLRRLEITDNADRIFNCDETVIVSHFAPKEKTPDVKEKSLHQQVMQLENYNNNDDIYQKVLCPKYQEL